MSSEQDPPEDLPGDDAPAEDEQSDHVMPAKKIQAPKPKKAKVAWSPPPSVRTALSSLSPVCPAAHPRNPLWLMQSCAYTEPRGHLGAGRASA